MIGKGVFLRYNDVGVKRYFDPLIPTDYSAFYALVILKTFEIVKYK